MPLVLTGDGAVGPLSATEVSYLDGVTSAVQTQIDGKLTTPGAWTSYTPTLSQGASTDIAKTVNYAKYTQIGKLVIVSVNLSPTASGTTNNAILCTLPVNAAAAERAWGSGRYNDGGVLYQCVAIAQAVDKVGLVRTDVTALNWVGTDPNIAVANGDGFQFTLTYEAA